MAKIVPVDQLQPAFKNALNHLYEEHRMVTVGEAVKMWRTYYDCYLLHDKDWVWESVAFKNEEQLAWFMLKWG